MTFKSLWLMRSLIRMRWLPMNSQNESAARQASCIDLSKIIPTPCSALVEVIGNPEKRTTCSSRCRTPSPRHRCSEMQHSEIPTSASKLQKVRGNSGSVPSRDNKPSPSTRIFEKKDRTFQAPQLTSTQRDFHLHGSFPALSGRH